MDERRDLVDRDLAALFEDGRASDELRRTVAGLLAPFLDYNTSPIVAADAVLAVPAIADALARDARVAEIARDAVWMAKLASGASWPGEMAHRVQQAADRVISALGTDADRAVITALIDTVGGA